MAINDPQASPPTPPRPGSERRGGGCLIAAGLLLGPIVGIMIGQTSAGLLGGLVLGILAAVALAVADRKR